jgi:hypothetical protein
MKCGVSNRCFLACVPVMEKLDYRIDKKAWDMVNTIRTDTANLGAESYGNRARIGMPGSKLSL